MSKLFRYPIPAIGMKGVYTLVTPFRTEPGEILECTAVRSLKSYIANNDEPLDTVYKPAGLTEDDYNNDLNEDMEIVSLVNVKGYRIQVPAKYLAGYPAIDGVYYRAITIGVPLPLMPVDQDLSFISTDIETLIKDRLGVATAPVLIETTNPVAKTQDEHKTITAARKAVISGDPTLYSTVTKQNVLIAQQAARIQALEAWIKAHP